MKLDAADQEQSYYQPAKRTVDQTIGFVLTGLCVILFFTIFLAGILQFQSVTTQPNTEFPRSASQPSPDIGGNVTVEPEPDRPEDPSNR